MPIGPNGERLPYPGEEGAMPEPAGAVPVPPGPGASPMMDEGPDESELAMMLGSQIAMKRQQMHQMVDEAALADLQMVQQMIQEAAMGAAVLGPGQVA